MNWNNGFTARYYAERVDPASWRDIGRYEIISGSISRTNTGLMESADIEMDNLPEGGEVWIRIYLDARQGEYGAREALFTGLLSVPATEWYGRRRRRQTECYSVLKPAEDVVLPRGWYAPAGMDGAALAAELLSVGSAPVTHDDNAPLISSNIIAEDNETNLTMAHRIIDVIGWRLRINGRGEIRICPKASEPSATFDAMENDIMELSVTDSFDWFSCPNVFRATSDDMTAIARDDEPDSPFSTVSRGREIWKSEQCTLNENESIAEYALRRLKEEQAPSRTVTYSRRFQPDLYVGDIATIHHPAQDIDGDFRITSQQIELKYGARTSEEAEYGS